MRGRGGSTGGRPPGDKGRRGGKLGGNRIPGNRISRGKFDGLPGRIGTRRGRAPQRKAGERARLPVEAEGRQVREYGPLEPFVRPIESWPERTVSELIRITRVPNVENSKDSPSCEWLGRNLCQRGIVRIFGESVKGKAGLVGRVMQDRVSWFSRGLSMGKNSLAERKQAGEDLADFFEGLGPNGVRDFIKGLRDTSPIRAEDLSASDLTRGRPERADTFRLERAAESAIFALGYGFPGKSMGLLFQRNPALIEPFAEAIGPEALLFYEGLHTRCGGGARNAPPEVYKLIEGYVREFGKTMGPERARQLADALAKHGANQVLANSIAGLD
ncbi:MAG: hypothetical protein V1493_04445 [Candidatus Diapherotrites archaeon]